MEAKTETRGQSVVRGIGQGATIGAKIVAPVGAAIGGIAGILGSGGKPGRAVAQGIAGAAGGAIGGGLYGGIAGAQWGGLYGLVRDKKKLEKAAHDGFCKEAQLGVKLLNKGRQMLQGSARAKTLSAAKDLRKTKQTARGAAQMFGGRRAGVKMTSPGIDKGVKAVADAKAGAGKALKRNAAIGGAGLAVGAAGGYAAS